MDKINNIKAIKYTALALFLITFSLNSNAEILPGTPGDIFHRYANGLRLMSIAWQPFLSNLAIAIFCLGAGLNLLKDIILFIIDSQSIVKLLVLIIKQLTIASIFAFWVLNPDILIDFYNDFYKF